MTAEKVNLAQAQDELLRDAHAKLDETSQSLAINGVDVALTATHTRGGQVVNLENGSAAPLCFIGRR